MVAHGHPDLNKGGAEIAAYNLHQALADRDDYETLFLARQVNDGSHLGTPFSQRSENELLFYSNDFDYFKFSQPRKLELCHKLGELLDAFKPDIVHFHHYLHVGLEALRIVKNVCPNAKIVLTLHEYLAICHNSGQMVKTDGRLCYTSSPADCHACFPEISAQNFFLREQFVKSFFSLVDQFIAPSAFLKSRYSDWGLAPERIAIIENGQATIGNESATPLHKPLRLAYFGQLTQFKGIDVLLRAIANLPKRYRKALHLDIHGTGLDWQPEAFQQEVKSLIASLDKLVSFHGAYEPRELAGLMTEVDYVVVPSNWWENSPMVIQEAFTHKKPVITSDIGGMAEKVADGQTGLHFRARKHSSLANILKRVVDDPDLYVQLTENIPRTLNNAESARHHDELYNGLFKSSQSATTKR